MREPRLTATSYLVLGLVGRSGPVTSYDMKQLVKLGLGNFWSFPHSQLYAEPERLAGLGYLSSEQEPSGRRRRLYSLTPMGQAALNDWLGVPVEGGTEIRDLALLKLYFCSLGSRADTVRVARAAAEWHAARVDEWEESGERLRDLADPCQLATLELGIRYERAAAAFWREIADDPPVSA